MFDTINDVVTEKLAESVESYAKETIADAVTPEEFFTNEQLLWRQAKRVSKVFGYIALVIPTSIAASIEKKINSLLKK